MTMSLPLSDRDALRRHRARAAHAPALFLHEDAADELHERLLEVNRTFTSPALVAPCPDIFATPFAAVLPKAKIVADDDILDLTPQAHDLVIHAMSLHWANDPVGQIIQCARALRPDGLFIAVFFGGQTLHELRAVLAEAEIAMTGGLSPRVVPMGEIRELGTLLGRAGLALPVADTFTRTVTYPNPLALLHDLRAMGETNALTARLRRPTARRVFADAIDRYTTAFSTADGRIRATFELDWLTGWKPHDSQQKPLRPGSAAHRLAEALHTTEQSTGEKPGL